MTTRHTLLGTMLLAALSACGAAPDGAAPGESGDEALALLPAANLFAAPRGAPTRYPVVLAHGFDASPTNRWGFYGVAEALRADGHAVCVATVPPYDSPAVRARMPGRCSPRRWSSTRASIRSPACVRTRRGGRGCFRSIAMCACPTTRCHASERCGSCALVRASRVWSRPTRQLEDGYGRARMVRVKRALLDLMGRRRAGRIRAELGRDGA